MSATPPTSLRLDKWLWAARFYKTRSLAADEIAKGRVAVNGLPAKASRELRPGDRVAMRHAGIICTVEVIGLSTLRGPAPVAQALYAETPDSVAAREAALALRRQGVEPAAGRPAGRPTKRDRRELGRTRDWHRRSDSVD